MFKKAQESKVQVTSLEDGFQRLQEIFRETALESLESETKLRDEISLLHSVIDALTNASPDEDQERTVDDLKLPECHINFSLRGGGGKRLLFVEKKK
jgi:hypothetical protein